MWTSPVTATRDELGRFLFERVAWNVDAVLGWDALDEGKRAEWITLAQSVVHAHNFGVPERRLQFPL